MRMLVVTWNLKGRSCNKEVLREMLRVDSIKYHLYSIGTEECQRSIGKSFFIQNKVKFENNIKYNFS